MAGAEQSSSNDQRGELCGGGSQGRRTIRGEPIGKEREGIHTLVPTEPILSAVSWDSTGVIHRNGGQLCAAEVRVISPTSAHWNIVLHVRAGRGTPSGHGAALHPPSPSGKGLLEVEKKGLSPPAQDLQHLCLFVPQEKLQHRFTFVMPGHLKEGERRGRNAKRAPGFASRLIIYPTDGDGTETRGLTMGWDAGLSWPKAAGGRRILAPGPAPAG